MKKRKPDAEMRKPGEGRYWSASQWGKEKTGVGLIHPE